MTGARGIDHTLRMRQPVRKRLVVAALLALASSRAAGWAVALHLVSDHGHHRPAPETTPADGLGMVTHGHPHAEGTPDHDHPLVGNAAATSPRGRPSPLASATTGHACRFLPALAPGCRLTALTGPNHDPPPRGISVSVLRI